MSGGWQEIPIVGLIVGILSFSGCTGELFTVIDGKEIKGVPVYPPAAWIEKYETTMLIVDGKVMARAIGDGPKCVPTPSSKIAIRPDYTKPHYIKYQHGYLEKYELEVELTESGMLKKVTTKSGPDRGETLKNLTAAAKDAASIAGGAPVTAQALAGGQMACNSGEVFRETLPLCKLGCLPTDATQAQPSSQR